MFWVMEYGAEIGTLKNLFREEGQALCFVHKMISELAQEGIAIILISSDLPEVLAMSDRILVMREGQQMAIFNREEATQESVMTAAMGQSETGSGVAG